MGPHTTTHLGNRLGGCSKAASPKTNSPEVIQRLWVESQRQTGEQLRGEIGQLVVESEETFLLTFPFISTETQTVSQPSNWERAKIISRQEAPSAWPGPSLNLHRKGIDASVWNGISPGMCAISGNVRKPGECCVSQVGPKEPF